MKAEITTDVVSYRREVERLSALTGRGLKDVMEEGVAIMAGQLARRFPPKSKSAGTRAIKNDLSRIINMEMTKPQLKNALAVTGDNRYDPSGDKIRSVHEQARKDNRQGHMRPKSVRGKTRLPNGWIASNKLYAPKSEVNKYARERAQRVGLLKSNWVRATVMFKGAARLPAWVTKQGANGRVVNAMKANGDGYIEIINPLPYASNWSDINAFVVRSQTRMFRRKIAAEIKKQADASNRRSK